MSKSLFTKEETKALMEFFDRVDLYDYLYEWEELTSAMDKLWSLLDNPIEKCW